MPYVYDPNLDKDNEEQQQGGFGEVKISGASPTTDKTGSGGNQGLGSSSGKELKTGSGFQNLDKYLETNQSQGFGNQVLGKVQDEVTNAGNQMKEAGDQFTNQVNQSSQTPTNEQVSQAIDKPNDADSKQFQGWMNQEYKGPNSLADANSRDAYNKFWSGTNQANASSKALGTEAGRFSLLDQYFGRPDYSFGEKSLDNLLVQQSGLGRETRNVQNQAAQLQTQGQQQSKELQNLASQRREAVDTSRQNVNQAFNSANSQAQESVMGSLAAANAARQQSYSDLEKGIQSGQLSDDQLKSLGLSRGQSLYNLNLDDFLTKNADLTKEQVASDEQRARLNALSQLAGLDQDFLGDAQAATNAYDFDTGRFGQAAASAKSGYEGALQGYNSSLSQGINLGAGANAGWNTNGSLSQWLQIKPGDSLAAQAQKLQDRINKVNSTDPKNFEFSPELKSKLYEMLNQVNTMMSYGANPNTGALRTL